MVRNDEYVKKVLYQIIESHGIIQNLNDKSGDLDIVKKELLKINGFFNVLVKKIGTNDFESKDFLELKSKIKKYLENYYFLKEIDTMYPLYSEDSARLKNIRLKILEAFEDKRLIDKIKELSEDL
ncbi:MAG: hypothetical protein R3237_03880 [Nitrosopumilaceae archaeon]|nr:hypothetical protein [Nitrosopumilaceae archaeon]